MNNKTILPLIMDFREKFFYTNLAAMATSRILSNKKIATIIVNKQKKKNNILKLLTIATIKYDVKTHVSGDTQLTTMYINI